jgi:hypothetical protein
MKQQLGFNEKKEQVIAGCGAYRDLASVMDSESIENIKVSAIAICYDYS